MNKLDIILKVLDDRKAEDVNVLELKDSSIADTFVIATGTSVIQTKALADYIEEKLEENGFTLLSKEGLREGEWILMDADDIIIHIFTQRQREFYGIDDLWEE
ncbi:ribosome silencing factor [Anaerococcus sp. Marseille-Q5996]|uniref:ribosome silencing factor n=1 Tax=Anaerococcus sp. Marseille-Q5996 TaxID=2972769 RepID=UPI0021C9DA39|nr:ribosome silencing factor [Anaerococcus sp. Marseille-Q5996]